MNNKNNPKKPYIRIFIACICIAAAVCGAVSLILAISAAQAEQFIYFDLAAGKVTINETTYTGYAYKSDSNGKHTREEITGNVTSGIQFYVYQSQGGESNPDGYFTEDTVDGNIVRNFTLPANRTTVMHDGKSWGDYITNNNDVNAVITAWNTDAATAGRKSTEHWISVTGKVNATIVIDNLWSSYHQKGMDRVYGGISFFPKANGSHLTIQTKGDNRFGNIFYCSLNNSNSDLTFEEFAGGGSTLTVADFTPNGDYNYWNSAIGASDTSGENADGLIFKSGTIFAGTTAADDCTAIGGGGNGFGGITIKGGTITAVVTSSGAAIGGGIGKSSHGGKANITISGGRVYAYNYSCESRGYTDLGVAYIPAAAIGGGSSGKAICDDCTVTITGGEVYAQSVGGTAIGGGSSADNDGGTATVTISGNAHVTARSIAGSIGGQDVPAGAAIGGGTGGKAPGKNGGNVTLTIEGTATVTTGSIGGGKTTSATGKIGSATVTINGGTLQGQIVMAAGSSSSCSFTMTGGTIDNSNRDTAEFAFLEKDGGAIWMDDKNGTAKVSGGIITGCSATNGGAVYMTAGAFELSGTGKITSCTATQNGGAVYMGGGTFTMSDGEMSSNHAINGAGAYLANGKMTVSGGQLTANAATNDGGGAYLGGGEFTLSQNGTLSNNNAQNGGGALVSNGSITVSGGAVEKNMATQNGGAFSITNGNYTMTGGTVTNNVATNGNGGAIYVSSQSNFAVTIRSGSITGNRAGKSGGALGVNGEDGAKFTVNIGSNTSHVGKNQCHAHPDGSSPDENCPVIKDNTSKESGGGIYFTGSYSATMNMYCLVESGNKVDGGASLSNFMKVEGGTLNISTVSDGNKGCGKVEINSTVHVTGGKVKLEGSASNPLFNATVTVDIQGEGSSFTDSRANDGTAYTIQYFENFEKDGKKSGQYKLIDVSQSAEHTVMANLYSATGYTVVGWTLMKKDGDKLVEDTAHPNPYTAGEKITVTRSYIFYAKWEVVGYTVIFEAGVNPYQGEMDPQGFTYDESKALTLNAFINPGYNFEYWYNKADSTETYKDGESVSGLADTHGATITLVAAWKICDHNDADNYTLSKTDSSVTRECHCHGYTETASLSSVTAVYNGQPQGTEVKYTRVPQTGTLPTTLWNFTVHYNGTSFGNNSYDSDTAPTNAGEYTGTITVSNITVSVKITINKAENPNRPAVPVYGTTTKTENGTEYNVITVTGPTDDNSGFTREYQFSWYEGTDLKTSKWMTWNNANTPSQQLEATYTNYYVYVRYAENNNYNASDVVQGTTTIYWTGNVTFEFSAGTGLTYRADKNESQSGITVTLTPSDTSYYIYDLKYTQTITGVDNYTNPAIEPKKRERSEWVIWIHDIKDADSDVTITINFSGAEKKATVSTSTAKDEVFDNISSKGNDGVTVSRDSAFTAYFGVNNYNHYKDPAVKFSQALPSGSTVIMIDRTDGSYWSYRVSSENSVESIPLADFVRMGTASEKYSVGSKTAFQLQFVVDFSDCSSYLATGDLTVSFYAQPVQPSSLDTVPAMPTTGGKVTLANTPTFKINTESQSNEGLSANVTYQFGIAQAGTGISKWENVRGILKLTLDSNSPALPADTKLKVTINNSTATYPLIENKFTVPLPSIGSGTASLTLSSDMLPNKDMTVSFTVSLGASATNVGTTPQSPISAGTVSIVYKVTKRANPALRVQINGAMPKYENNNITPLQYMVTVKYLPEDYTVQATLYSKNADDKYSSTTKKDDKITVDENGSWSGTLSLDSVATNMQNSTGSLSMMLKVEILDTNGKAVESVPLYFVIIDTRQ